MKKELTKIVVDLSNAAIFIQDNQSELMKITNPATLVWLKGLLNASIYSSMAIIDDITIYRAKLN